MSRKASVILKCVSRVKYGWGSSSYDVLAELRDSGVKKRTDML